MQIEDSKKEKEKEPNLTCEPGIGFSLRDKNIKTQEEKGLFEFVVIKNTGENTKENLDNMKLLTDLKNIIILFLNFRTEQKSSRGHLLPPKPRKQVRRNCFFSDIIFGTSKRIRNEINE